MVDFQEVIKLILFKTILGLYLTQSDVDKYYSGYSTENITNQNTYLNIFCAGRASGNFIPFSVYVLLLYDGTKYYNIFLEKDINFPMLYRTEKVYAIVGCIHILHDGVSVRPVRRTKSVRYGKTIFSHGH